MSNINEYSVQSSLAQAAYGSFSVGLIDIDKLTAKEVEMPISQATQFAATWNVADQFSDLLTGVSATIFEAKEGGAKYLAIRGTELEAKDILADGILASAIPPIINPQFTALQLKLNAWLNDPNVLQGQNFTVTGHSLGGYLAAAVKQSYAQATEAYLYNAPGVGGLLGNLADAVSGALGLNNIAPDSIWNLRGSEGFPLISGLGFQLGTSLSIQTEASGNNHSISLLTDALAVYSSYSQLLPDISIEQLSKLIDAFGSTKDIGGSNGKTLESALDALRTIVLNPGNGKIALADNQKTESGSRDKFYTNLYELVNSTQFKDLSGKVQLTSLSDFSASAIIAKIESDGQQGLAARFALVALNPFILEGEGIDYGAFNTHGELDLFNPEMGTGTLTSSYLVDRMTMLMRKNWFNIEDKNPLDSTVTLSSSNHRFQNINDYFEDVSSGYKISQGELSGKTPRYFFGSDGVDNPAASAVEDHLYGGGGDDVLKGLEGNDYLEGGAGADTYIINPGHGTDTVLDTDGAGVIQFGTVIAQGRSGVTDSKDWIKIGDTWMDQKNDLVYLRVAQDNGSYDLFVSFVGAMDSARVRIKNWSDGKLGIALGDNAPIDASITDRTIRGDLKPEDPLDYDELGNVVASADEEADREDFLYGSAENDYIRSLGGNDEVDGKDGKDRIEGGAGDDILAGGAGEDVVLGEAGSDIIRGQLNNDRLFAQTEYTLDAAYTLSATQTGSGERGDLLDGNAGDDTLIGDAGDDILMGGQGKDILVGLGGNDTIESDRDVEQADRNWKVNRAINAEADVTTYSRVYSFTASSIELAMVVGDDDVISSGTGKDWVFAGGGNDFIDAGVDNDVIFGDAGNDTILGQAGDDAVLGDGHHSKLDASLHGNDYLSGGSGNDLLAGAGGADYLNGGADRDMLIGDGEGVPAQYQGDDFLDGDDGDDQLFGGGGNDTLVGGSGNDELYGGAGNDSYIGVAAGDYINDLEGRNTIVLAEIGSANVEADPMAKRSNVLQDFAANSGNITSANMLSDVTWLRESGILRITLGNGGMLDLQDALYGMDAQIRFDHGSNSIDLKAWASENLHEGVVLNVSSVGSGSGGAIVQAYGGAAADFIQGSINSDILEGYGGDDYLMSNSGDDFIVGGSGHDVMLGQNGADTLQGGLGADRNTGGSGADTYLFNLGDGADIITSAFTEDARGDEVRLGEGITASDLHFFKLADGSLLMRIADTQDSILFDQWFNTGANVAALRLADLSMIGANEMSALAMEVYGGTNGDDVLIGTVADDRIEGYAGNDTFDGGVGNDFLTGGDGKDTYLFGGSSIGHDIIIESLVGESLIQLTEGIMLSDLRHIRMGNDLILTLQGGGATLTFTDYYISMHSLTILDATNEAIDVADWILLPQPSVDISQLQADFLDAARSQWATALLNNAWDKYYGQYERINGETYRAQLVTGYETDTMTQHFKLLDFVSDLPTIERQSDGDYYSRTTINLFGSTAPVEQPVPKYFYPIDTLYLIPSGAGHDIQNWDPVFDQNDQLIGFLVNAQMPPPFTRDYFLNTHQIDTVVEFIHGGDNDNVIKGFKQDDFSAEISMIDGGAGNDTLYASGIPVISNEFAYYTDDDLRIGGFLNGNDGNDALYGNYFQDTLIGGSGNDYLNGGFSQDIYVMFNGEFGVDRIWDTGTQVAQWRDSSTDNAYAMLVAEPRPIVADTLQLVGINQEEIEFSWSSPRVVEGVRAVVDIKEALYTQTMHATFTMTWTGGGAEIVLPNSTDLPGMGLERIQFGNGTVLTIAELIALAGSALTLNPQELDNTLVGVAANDVLYGEGGNDSLYGEAGDDFLNGGIGDDILTGGPGNDMYLFSKGSGYDTINSYDTTPDKIDTVLFDTGITPDEVRIGRSGNHLTLTIGSTGDILTILNYLENDGATPFAVQQIQFNEDDAVWDLAAIKAKLASDNHAPELLLAIPDQSALEGIPFSYSLDMGAFDDPDGDALTYSAILVNGNSLPSWLSFDPSMRTLSGILDTPGSIDVRITAADPDALTISDTFTIVIAAQNLALNGTLGSDILSGASGNDVLNGFAGNDTLYGFAGDDRLNGGKGIDVMTGGAGNDTFLVNRAADIVNEDLNGGYDTVIASVVFTLGEHVENLVLSGTVADTGIGNPAANAITGNKSANILWGRSGDDMLSGAGGADTLYGESGDDTLDGGIGRDTLEGGSGNDTYLFGRGYGRDIVIENDASAKVIDRVVFLPTIEPGQLWFKHAGNNLQVSVIGTNDRLVFKDWYLGSAYHIEQFITDDGLMLHDSNVENLVTAMVGFEPPEDGQTILPPDYAVSLDPVITAFWL